MLDASTLRKVLDYDPRSGVFTRRTGGRGVAAGDVAGCLDKRRGYLLIRVGGRLYKAHRLAWLYVHGEWPPNEIDHVNCEKNDNRIANLRLATGSQNQANKRLQANNTSGAKGVSWLANRNKWKARIRINGKLKHLGHFERIEDAADAYRLAASFHFGDFGRAEALP